MTDLAVFTDHGSTPSAVKAWMEHVTEMRRAVLVEGVDYMKIPGTPKPCLLQPGAEKLLLLSGLGFHMTRTETTPDGVYYRCVVDGRAECEGYAGRDERNFKTAPWNTIVKMAQKRAKVGAISSALALSGLFTIDLEDYQAPVGHGTQGEPATPPEVGHETPDRPLPRMTHEQGNAPAYTPEDIARMKREVAAAQGNDKPRITHTR